MYAFQYCHPDFTIYGVSGSYAETYAKENNIPFIAIDDIGGDTQIIPTVTINSYPNTIVYTDTPVNFALSTTNATKVKLIADDTWEFEYPVESGSATTVIERAFSLAGERSIAFRACNSYGEWGPVCEPVLVHVVPAGSVSAPVFNGIPVDGILLNNDTTITWSMPFDETAAGIDHYEASLFRVVNGEETAVCSAVNTAKNGALNLKSYLTISGNYLLKVEAVGIAKSSGPAENGKSTLAFGYRTVPEFALSEVQCSGIMGSDVTVRWNPPAWAVDSSQQPDQYIVWVYGPNVEQAFTVEGGASSFTLPGSLFKATGGYTVDVYAVLGEGDQWQQSLASGYNIMTFGPTEISIDMPSGPYLASDELHVMGKATGGIQYVRVQLEKNGGPAVVPVSDGEGMATDYFVGAVDAQSREYYIKLIPYEAMSLSDSNAVAVYGYATLEDAQNDTNRLANNFIVLTVNGSAVYSRKIVSSNSASVGHTWRYTGEQMHVEVTGNRAMNSLSVTADGRTVAMQSSTDTDNYGRTLTSESFSFNSVGMVTVSVSVDADVKYYHVYAVESQAAQTAYINEAGAAVYSLPREGVLKKTLAMNDSVQVIGSYGTEIRLIRYSGGTGFIAANLLSSQKDESLGWKMSISGTDDPVLTVIAGNASGHEGERYTLYVEEHNGNNFWNYNITIGEGKSQNTWTWRLVGDLNLNKTKVYEFRIYPYLDYSAEDVPMLIYGAQGRILQPYSGRTYDFFDSGKLDVEWAVSEGAEAYSVFMQIGGQLVFQSSQIDPVDGAEKMSFTIDIGDTSITDAMRNSNQSATVWVSAYFQLRQHQ